MTELFQAQEMQSAPTPLEAARRALQKLQDRRDNLHQSAVEAGNEGQLEATTYWRDLLWMIQAAQTAVAAEEQVERTKFRQS